MISLDLYLYLRIDVHLLLLGRLTNRNYKIFKTTMCCSIFSYSSLVNLIPHRRKSSVSPPPSPPPPHTHLVALDGNYPVSPSAWIMVEGHLDCSGRSRKPFLLCFRVNLKDVRISREHCSLSVSVSDQLENCHDDMTQ